MWKHRKWMSTNIYSSCRRYLNTPPKDVKSQMPIAYQAASVETGWYPWWEKNNFFRSEDTRNSTTERFSMVLPPPNITGTLHLGHTLTCAIQDALVSWNRMKGKDVVWFPGCDHAGIATQVVVEKKLKLEGITREQLGRERFLEEVWKWKSEKESIIYQQLKAMGATLQWDKSVFTMDPNMCDAVNEAFVRLHRSGKIYRKESLVNWSCQLQSAISDIEVEHREISGPKKVQVPGYDAPVMFGQIYEFAYKLSDSYDDAHIMVSTTRPETLIGDTAIAVHPEDDRFAKYIGRTVHHPIRHEEIPIIADPKVDRLFGTGAIKVTPGHDVSDFDIAERHNLVKLNIFDDRGNANENCGEYAGLPRFELREKMITFLKDKDLLGKILPHPMVLPICSRSGDVIEPLLRHQWFVSTASMAARAIEAVEKGHLKIHSAQFENVWFEWLNNIKDWCISRQLWWGHRIPAYYLSTEKGNGIWVAAHSSREASDYARSQGILTSSMYQDGDVLDTWFSSSLFPFAVCGWPKQTLDLKNLFPLDLLETGHDILFFWVARMVMLSLELTGQLPFKEVLLHGIICDSLGRKMSKSLGNVIDPMDIIRGTSLQSLEENLEASRQSGLLSSEEFLKARNEKRNLFPDGFPPTGADPLRFTLCSYNVKSHFINLDMDTLKRNRLFCNKIWQATRFMFLYLDRKPASDIVVDLNSFGNNPADLLLINRWLLSRLHTMVYRVNAGLARYDFHHATDALYNFLYGEFCDVYLEAVKPLTGQEQEEAALVMAKCLDVSLRCLAPFMPFLAEELYQRLHCKLTTYKIQSQRAPSILIAQFPEQETFVRWRHEEMDRDMELVLLAIAELRGIKLQYNVKKLKPDVTFVTSSVSIHRESNQFSALIATLAGVGKVEICQSIGSTRKDAATMIIRTVRDCSVHMNVTGIIDRKIELKKSSEKLKKLEENLMRLESMMNNTSYTASAPVQIQEKHRAKIEALRNETRQVKDYVQMLNSDSV